MKNGTKVMSWFRWYYYVLLKRYLMLLPKEGSRISFQVNYQFGTIIWNGIVEHHCDGRHFMIVGETSTLCCIKPKNKYYYLKQPIV